jgi:galactokinase
VKAYAPGRVNLIGEHTDYTGGLVLPMAIDLGTTVESTAVESTAVGSTAVGGAASPDGDVRLSSEAEPDDAVVPLTVTDPSSVEPPWARYVAGVVFVLRPATGFAGSVRTTLPIGAGLSSSAALEVALALALGFDGTPVELARACQEAEQVASGVPCGVMDQLAAAAGVAGHALLIDCSTLTVEPVPLPAGVEVVVVDSGVRRALAGSAYAQRRAECEAAAHALGIPLCEATPADVARLPDAVLRRRARHVVSENERVRALVGAFAAVDHTLMGVILNESHASLRDDFDVSTPELDALVARLTRTPGVIGARLTGAGFGGCAVALVHADAAVEGRRVRPSAGAHVVR